MPAGPVDRTAVLDDRDEVTYDDLAADVLGLRRLVPEGGVAVLRAHRAMVVAAARTSLEGWASEIHLAGGVDLPERPGDVGVDDDASLRREPSSPGGGGEGGTGPTETRWRLFTSGTTGEPKPIDHTLGSLTRTVRSRVRDEPWRWGLLYDPTRMAGIQVVLQALGERAPLLDATALATVGERVAWLADNGAQALSATPTMWRQILQSPASRALELRQATLGGEIADQLVLDALARRFPEARVTHVFASTETGVGFAVSDGREGFPLSYLDATPDGIPLDVRDGILHVYAPDTSAADPDGYASTGDVVEVVGDRVLFRGRASGIVNVGGVKVWPEEVEAALRTHPDVEDAVVTAKPNPFSGFILRASVTARPGADVGALPAALRAHCGERLSSAHVPAVVKVVDELTTGATGKAVRA